MKSFLLLLVCLCMAPLAWAQDAERLDVRILIDVSGSMKKTDPENLRQPALRLLAGLLPLGAKAGVWSFERNTVNLAPLQQVDEAWRQKAVKSAERIHSRGLFTHIEGALQVVAGDWFEPDPGHDRHLILLTDGMVDVSPNQADSQASRERILSGILPELKAAGVRIHSVALSQEADRDLLRHISRETGGLFEAIDSPERLQRIFLGLFEQASKPDSLPIKDNQFQVDKGIKEATVILFRSKDAAPVHLIDPEGRAFNQATKAPNMRWFQDRGYELITIEQPLAGQWQVQAEMDPDNRVMVVTDLKMRLGELPTQALAQTRLNLKALFSDKETALDKVEFLRLVQVSGQLFGSKDLNALASIAFLPDVAAGGFSTSLVLPQMEGDIELVVQGSSATFSRQQRHRMTLRQAIKLNLDTSNPELFRLKLVLDSDLKEPSLELLLKTDAGDQPRIMEMVDEHSWQAEISPLDFSGEAKLQLRVRGEYLGQAMELHPESFQILGNKPESKPEPAPKPEPEPEPQSPPDVPAAAEQPAPEPELAAPDAEEVETPLGLGWMVFGLANLVGLLALGGGFWFWRRRRMAGLVDALDIGGDVPGTEAMDSLDTHSAPVPTDKTPSAKDAT